MNDAIDMSAINGTGVTGLTMPLPILKLSAGFRKAHKLCLTWVAAVAAMQPFSRPGVQSLMESPFQQARPILSRGGVDG
jgi:hypothetical protein